MKKLIRQFMFAMILSAGIAPLSYAAGDMTAPGSMAAPGMQAAVVKGDLLKVDGDFYVVKDPTGKEIRLHVDKTSKLDGAAFKAGDKIEAQATDKDHALSMKHAQPIDIGPGTQK